MSSQAEQPRALSEMSLVNPETVAMPHEYYQAMRGEAPVRFDEKAGVWLVTRFDDIRQAARMTDVLSNGLGLDSSLRAPWQQELDEMMLREGFGPHKSGDNFNVDPPLHSRRRGLVNQALGGNAVAKLKPNMESIVRELADRFIETGEAELVSQYAIPTAIFVISDLLGVPRERVDDVKRWSDAAVAPFGQGLTKDQAFAYARDLMDMHRYLDEEITDRRNNRGDDMISNLVHAQIDDDENPRLSHAELLSCSVALLAAGNETTRNAIGWGLYFLAQDPQLFGRLKASLDQDEKLLDTFIEETLRIEPPVPQLPRMTVADCEIGGVAIPKGSLVYLCWASGNRDSDWFEGAEQFDMERKNIRLHLSFGHGVHRCVGSMLARMEMKCAFKEVLTRMQSLALREPDADLDIWGTVVFRGLRSLPVKFET